MLVPEYELRHVRLDTQSAHVHVEVAVRVTDSETKAVIAENTRGASIAVAHLPEAEALLTALLPLIRKEIAHDEQAVVFLPASEQIVRQASRPVLGSKKPAGAGK